MASVPVAERPPKGLDAIHLGIWRHAFKALKAQGRWKWEMAPLLAEYVFALQAARDAREGFKWLDALEQYAENADDLPDIAWTKLGQIAGGLPTQWDRHAKRAAALAGQLGLVTPAAAAASPATQAPRPADPFANLGKSRDELAARRGAS
jgi:hypothetical protein